MKKILFLLTMCLLATAAQAFTITGRVTDDKGEALPYVSLYMPDAKMGGQSDLDGKYHIRDVEAGKYKLVVSLTGYATQVVMVDVKSDVNVNFKMDEQAYTLNEVFVTPTGESFERFILSQVVKNTVKLKNRVDHYNSSREMYFEQRDNQLGVLIGKDHLKLLDFLLKTMGIKDFFHSLMDNPDLRLDMKGQRSFVGGSIKDGDFVKVKSTPELTEAQIKSWNKMLKKSKDNGYDAWYEGMASRKKNLEKMDKKTPGESEKVLKYVGAYEEGNHVVHIIKYYKSEFHIVDGCWQLRRAIIGGKAPSRTEFMEVAPDLFMPVSRYKEMSLNFINDNTKELDYLNKEEQKKSFDKLSEKDKEKHYARKAELEALKGREPGNMAMMTTENYHEFVLKSKKK